MRSIKEVLMARDGKSAEEADELIIEAGQALQEYLDSNDLDSAFYICEEFFGLEPDYNDELLKFVM